MKIMNCIIKYICLCIFLLSDIELLGQEYYELYSYNAYFKENNYIDSIPNLSIPPTFVNIKNDLPQPVWTARQDVIRAYWAAWKIAFSNLKSVEPKSGFVSPYIDAAFNDCIFMWDTSFMVLFGKYGTRAFNFQGSLDNFYACQKSDGFICREIRSYNGTDCFERFDPSSTGPNIMPWAEWEYFENFGDTLRLKKIFSPLMAYYHWLRINRTWKDGSYFLSGWGCGMDNQPRVPKGYDTQWGNAHMSWVDANMQQILSAKVLLKMAKILNRSRDTLLLKKDIQHLSQFVNKRMWNKKLNFYTDLFEDGSLSSTLTIGSYWSLLADVVPANRLKKYVLHLSDSTEFCRYHRVPSLAATDDAYEFDGGYWRGGVWAPTVYMVLKGLTKVGMDSLAYEIADNHLNNVVSVFNQTKTFFENYSPERLKGNDRKNFVGWTGLSPIAILLEYIFGIRPDVPHNRIILDVRMTDEYGVNNYPFGPVGIIDLLVKARKTKTQRPIVEIKSNVDFTLTLLWEGGMVDIPIKASC